MLDLVAKLLFSFFSPFLLQERSKPGHSGSLPSMGGPGMVPHHNYPIPSDNFGHSGGRLAYRPGLGQLMGQSMQMGPSLSRVPPGISNDMGPPIFMPCESS